MGQLSLRSVLLVVRIVDIFRGRSFGHGGGAGKVLRAREHDDGYHMIYMVCVSTLRPVYRTGFSVEEVTFRTSTLGLWYVSMVYLITLIRFWDRSYLYGHLSSLTE